MTLANRRGGSGPQISTSIFAVLVPCRYLLWQLAGLVLAVGVTPTTFATTAPVDCTSLDDSRTCLDRDSSLQTGAAHSLLQVSKPHKALEKAHFPKSDEKGSSQAKHQVQAAALAQPKAAVADANTDHSAKGTASHRPLPAAVASSYDVRHHSRHGTAAHGSPGTKVSGANALSFIQTAESVLESANVVDGASQEDAGPFAMEQAHLSGWRRSAHVVMLGSVLCLAAWALCWISGGCGRPSLLRIGRLSQAGRVKPSELPKPESTSPSPTCNFKDPLLPKASASFSIPLTHHTEVGSSKTLCFTIPRHPDGRPVSAMVTCQPEGSTWASVQLFEGEAGGGNFTSPLASCRLVHSTSDVESRNIQGAMMSWLSLLLHEKEGAEADAVATMAPGDPESAGLPPSQVRTCLHGIAEDLMAAGTAGSSEGKDSSMRLEVRDSIGLLAGTLEPGSASKPGRYALMRQGKLVFDIETKPDGRSIALSKQDEVLALATHLGNRRNPESPELVPEEDDHLQVDIRDGADWSETTLLLICTLAMTVFKPKDRKASENVEDARADVEARTTEETAQVTQEAVADSMAKVHGTGEKRPLELAYYQRQPMQRQPMHAT